MGVDVQRPPLPAPTESMDENSGVDTEVATNVTSRTDKTSHTIPEDGSPITISTQRVSSAGRPGHRHQKSQTSLLIEYYESGKSGDKFKGSPSVRVKVTQPSSAKRGKTGGHDAIQLTTIGKDRKTSFTRRISLPSSRTAETGAPTDLTATEVSHSSESNLSGRTPLEIEVMKGNGSDLSHGKSSRGLLYANESNVSSMPPDSMLEGSGFTESEVSRGLDNEADRDNDHLVAPLNRSRSRSGSRNRITQKVMEKLGAGTTSHSRKVSGRSHRDRKSSKEYDDESSFLSSQLTGSQRSYRSGSESSRVTNNPKLLEVVEDTIKRMILPQLDAIKEEAKTDRNMRSFEHSRASMPKDGYESNTTLGGLERRVSKSSSSPNIASKPRVVLNRDGDDPGTTLSRGDSERRHIRRSSRESTEHRPSSRRSSGRHSSRGVDEYEEEEHIKEKSGKSGHGLRDAAAAGGMAGGILTAAALHRHDSQDSIHTRRKKRSKSRSSHSRSASRTDTTEHAYTRKEDIPPLPMASHINDSDVTRDSLVSSVTERPGSRDSLDVRTPVREVSRGSIGDGDITSPISSRTPTRTPVSKTLGMSHTNRSIDSPDSAHKNHLAALAAAGLGGAAAAKLVDEHHERTHEGPSRISQRSVASPVQSVSSLRKTFEEDDALMPSGLRPKSAASRSSAGQLRETHTSRTSMQSPRSSPTTARLAQSRKHSQNISGDEFVTPLEQPNAHFMREGTPGTPTGGESVDDWFERQHKLNDRYRDSMGETTTNRDSYQTNPYPEDDKRFAGYTDDSFGSASKEEEERGVRHLAAMPEVHDSPYGVESAVASLMEPSNLSSGLTSSGMSQESPTRSRKGNGTYADRMADLSLEDRSPPLYEGSTMSQTMPSRERWAALKGHARDLSTSATSHEGSRGLASPRQSPAKSLRGERSVDGAPVMTASGLPIANDPIPEIGHYEDSASDLTTNPSIIHGPLGGDATGKDTWPYTPEPPGSAGKDISVARDATSVHSRPTSRHDGLAAAAAGGAAALVAAHHMAKQPTVEDERSDVGDRLTPDLRRPTTGNSANREATPVSPAAFRDEGYVTDGRARSAGHATPQSQRQAYGKRDVNAFNRAMDVQSTGGDDPFTEDDVRHARHVRGNSHGMDSPLYDSATGKGVDHINSKDIVALMDHLTVRDAQRNARDTEILVTLVRSAAEMRQSFDEMKKFIAGQDRMIMHNTDRNADQTVQRVLGGPRPQPFSPRSSARRDSQDDVQAKRKNVLRRALKGLTGGKKADDLARIEDMFMQILDGVEDLRHGGMERERRDSDVSEESVDSYERLRAAPDSGYEPEGHAGTNSTPSQSGQLATTPRADKQQFHSGYDGRRGSVNRVSTVLEGDEDDGDLTPDEERLLNQGFENNERLLTPTQESVRRQGLSPAGTPPHQVPYNAQAELTPQAADKQRKHKSNSSSVFGAKVSRWSKTTSSSAAPDPATLDSPNHARELKAAASRSGSQLGAFDDDGYSLQDDDRLRSTQSLAREQQQRPVSQSDTKSMRSQASRLTRTPSPLIPSETSHKDYDTYDDRHRELSPIQHDDQDDASFDDPKYQAHRNSLLLEHPQPRQGPTGRHQTTLETQAYNYYDDASGTNSDLSQRTVSDSDPLMFGSAGTAALARNRLSQTNAALSPVSLSSPTRGGNGPLVPQQRQTQPQQSKPNMGPPPKIREPEPSPEDEYDDEPQYSNSGFGRGGYYTSPYGSGHLLEPIEEVRYSLETDSGHISPEPQVSSAREVNMRNTSSGAARKITGPRPMGAGVGGVAAGSGTVRRKPIAGGN